MHILPTRDSVEPSSLFSSWDRRPALADLVASLRFGEKNRIVARCIIPCGFFVGSQLQCVHQSLHHKPSLNRNGGVGSAKIRHWLRKKCMTVVGNILRHRSQKFKNQEDYRMTPRKMVPKKRNPHKLDKLASLLDLPIRLDANHQRDTPFLRFFQTRFLRSPTHQQHRLTTSWPSTKRRNRPQVESFKGKSTKTWSTSPIESMVPKVFWG